MIKTVNLFIENISICNHKCPYCYFKSLDNNYTEKTNLTINDYDNIIKYIKELPEDISMDNITISGGEPFIDKNLKYILSKLKNNFPNTNISINTNLTVNITDDIISFLNENDIGLFVSLISLKKEKYNEITQSNDYDIFVDNLRKLKKHNFKGIIVNLVMIKETIETFEYTINKAITMGIDSFSIIAANTNYNFNSYNGVFNKIDKNDYIYYSNICNNLAKNKDLNIRLFRSYMPCELGKDNNARFKNCPAGSAIIFIGCDGQYKLCGHDGINDSRYGNIINTSIFESLKLMEQDLKNILNNFPEECANCKMNKYCHGNCNFDTLTTDIVTENIDDINPKKIFINNCKLSARIDIDKYFNNIKIKPWEFISVNEMLLYFKESEKE